jgi:hypothetical protein
MTRHLLLGNLLALLILSGCAAVAPTSPASSSARLDVSELTIRAIYADAVHSDRVIAICFPGFSDPGDAFLSRLAPMQAAPCSALKDHSATHAQVIAETGKPAITIYIEKISFTDPNTITVNASEWMEALNGGGYLFKFNKVGGRWKLINQDVTWQG